MPPVATPTERHDDIIDQRGDDFAESGTDYHTDCHVDDIATHGKFP